MMTSMMRVREGGPRRPTVMVTVVCGLAALSTCASPEAVVEEIELGSVVVTQWNDSTELFLEYPHPVAGRASGNWAIHLSSMKDFKPIRSGTLTVRFMSGPSTVQTFTINGVARDGIFLLDPVIERPGRFEVSLSLESPQITSLHVLPEVEVFASEGEVPLAEEDEGGGIAFLKEQQWQIPFEVLAARESAVQRTVAAPGEIVAPDGALVQVSAPVDGLADAEANRNAPSVGQSVGLGQVLAVLSPTTQEGGFAQIRAQSERLEREVARAERLYEAGAIPRRRLEEAQHDLDVVRAQAAAMGADGDANDFRLRLTSPIRGVVARRWFIPGGRLRAGEPLFTIVDRRTAWVRVQIPVSAASSIADASRATFTVEGSGEVRGTRRLVSVGSVLNPETRTVPVVFETADAGSAFTFGQLAQAAVPVGGTVDGVVIPNRAIVDDNGTPVAYVQVSGETFERRVLTLGATDGLQSQVLAGIRIGEMVVTTGGYQVRLASMSGDEFAGGHAH